MKWFLVCILSICRLPVEAQTINRLDGKEISPIMLTRKLEQLARDAKVHGMAISIFNDGKAVYQRTFGHKRMDKGEPLQWTTNFYGASLSKAVFAVLVMKLVEEKVISLDKPLQSYLPQPVFEYTGARSWNEDYKGLKEDSLYQEITARMCLTHTSGFPNWRWDEKDQKLRVKFKPGTHYSYSGEGFCYLQFVLQQLTGRTLESLVEEKVFRPAGMKRSAYTWKPEFENNYCWGHGTNGVVFAKDKDNAPRAASTLETTPEDYTRFLEAVLQGKILKASSSNELFGTHVRIRTRYQMAPESWKDTSSAYDHLELGYGLGWGVLQTPYGTGVFKEGHGQGFQHYSILFPSRKMGILIMTNSDNGESIFKELLESAIGDVFTPWQWQRYLPYNQKN